MNKKLIRSILEITIFPFFLTGVNLFFPDDPGFIKTILNPFFIFSCIVGGRYGKYPASYSVVLNFILTAFAFPYLKMLLYNQPMSADQLILNLRSLTIPYSVSLVVSFIIGAIRDSADANHLKIKDHLKSVSRAKGLLQKEIKALKTVNFELEKRVLTQKDSIIALYSRIQKLYNSNFEKALGIIIETVKSFVEVESCSIWEYKQEEKKLNLLIQSGWDEAADSQELDEDGKGLTTIDADNTIEGWVVRNNMTFSAKLLMQYENLKQMDRGRNIFTVPILAGNRVWGVLNIEKLPFEKYNLYTEKLLLIIMALVAPALERSIEYESFNIRDTVDPVTNLPLFSQFYIILEKEIGRLKMQRGSLSIVILELKNYPDLLDDFNKQDLSLILLRISEKVTLLSNSKAVFFHHKSDNQISMIYPNMDYDGCSLFCLNLLEMINTTKWLIQDKTIFPEIIIGYASITGDASDANELITAAENLLEMQKV